MTAVNQTEPTTDRRAALVAGLRTAADFIEAHPDLDVWRDARIARHLNADEFGAVVEALGVEPGFSSGSGFAHATRRFGPVDLSVQTDARALREADNLAAFWDAYCALDETPSDVEDMARRYALTPAQVAEVLDQITTTTYIRNRCEGRTS